MIGSGLLCWLYPVYVITVGVLNYSIGPEIITVVLCYSRKFVITVIVITDFDCSLFQTSKHETRASKYLDTILIHKITHKFNFAFLEQIIFVKLSVAKYGKSILKVKNI